eukprot:767540-Hanusia_phi.AAC.1
MSSLEDCGTSPSSCGLYNPFGLWSGFVIAGVVDNDISSSYANQYHSDTTARTIMWFRIDLGVQKDIQSVSMWARYDCCPAQASGTTILIGDDDGGTGRYVFLYNSKASADYFSFSEVAIDGCTRCPAGYTTLSTGSTSSAACSLPLPICPLGSWSPDGLQPRTLQAANSYTGLTNQNNAFSSWSAITAWDNDLRSTYTSQGHAGVLRLCSSCSASHQIIYYDRLSDPTSFSVSYNFLWVWASSVNAMLTDFNMFGSSADYTNVQNHWTFCNYDDAAGVGAFRDCGSTAAVGSQWIETRSTLTGQANWA